MHHTYQGWVFFHEILVSAISMHMYVCTELYTVKLISCCGSQSQKMKNTVLDNSWGRHTNSETALEQHTMILTVSHYTRSVILSSVFRCPIIFSLTFRNILQFFHFVLSKLFWRVAIFLPAMLNPQPLFRGAETSTATPQMRGPTFPGQVRRGLPKSRAVLTYLGVVHGALNTLGAQYTLVGWTNVYGEWFHRFQK